MGVRFRQELGRCQLLPFCRQPALVTRQQYFASNSLENQESPKRQPGQQQNQENEFPPSLEHAHSLAKPANSIKVPAALCSPSFIFPPCIFLPPSACSACSAVMNLFFLLRPARSLRAHLSAPSCKISPGNWRDAWCEANGGQEGRTGLRPDALASASWSSSKLTKNSAASSVV